MLKRIVVKTLFFGIGIFLGLIIPDADLRLRGLLIHRSIVTHGLVVSGLSVILALWSKDERVRTLAVGICIATAVHMVFDMFPLGWRGFALIHIPFYGRTTPAFSWVYSLISIVGSLYVAFLFIRRDAFEIGLTFVGLLTAFMATAVKELFVIPALITLIIIVGGVFMLPTNPFAYLRNLIKKMEKKV